MKKVLSLVCLLALVATCLFAFASCGSPNEDPAEAKKALEGNGYTVNYAVNDDGVGKLYASKGEKDDAQYITIQWFATEEEAEAEYKKLEEQVEAFEKSIEELEKQLSEAEGTVAEELEKQLEEAEKELDDANYGISGKMIWSGTSQAVSDAK